MMAGPRVGYGGGQGQSTIIAGPGTNWYFTNFASIVIGRKAGEFIN